MAKCAMLGCDIGNDHPASIRVQVKPNTLIPWAMTSHTGYVDVCKRGFNGIRRTKRDMKSVISYTGLRGIS